MTATTALIKYRLFERIDNITHIVTRVGWFVMAAEAAAAAVFFIVVIMRATLAQHTLGEPLVYPSWVLPVALVLPVLFIANLLVQVVSSYMGPLYDPADEKSTRQELSRAAVIKRNPELAGMQPSLIDSLFNID